VAFIPPGLAAVQASMPLALPPSIARADAASQFLGVDWGEFAVVFLVALASTAVVVSFYAVGLRLLAVGSDDDTGADGAITSSSRGQRPAAATAGAYLCIAVCIAVVLYSLYLIIPQFH
jgi:uncharacterized membrane protein